MEQILDEDLPVEFNEHRFLGLWVHISRCMLGSCTGSWDRWAGLWSGIHAAPAPRKGLERGKRLPFSFTYNLHSVDSDSRKRLLAPNIELQHGDNIIVRIKSSSGQQRICFLYRERVALMGVCGWHISPLKVGWRWLTFPGEVGPRQHHRHHIPPGVSKQ